MEIKLASECESILNIRTQMAKIFVDCFGEWLHYFSKDSSLLCRAFEHMFFLEHFYVILEDTEIVGYAGLTDVGSKSVKLNKKALKAHLGGFKGRLAYYFLKKEFEKPYPFDMELNTASIEFVSVRNDFRKKGYAQELLKYIISSTSFNHFILEVADTNYPALSLYTKLGFIEFFRLKMKYPEKSGIQNLLYLKHKKRDHSFKE